MGIISPQELPYNILNNINMSKALQTVSFCAAAMKNERVPCQRKLIIFILYGLSQVVNVGRSVIIFGISCLCKLYVELRG